MKNKPLIFVFNCLSCKKNFCDVVTVPRMTMTTAMLTVIRRVLLVGYIIKLATAVEEESLVTRNKYFPAPSQFLNLVCRCCSTVL